MVANRPQRVQRELMESPEGGDEAASALVGRVLELMLVGVGVRTRRSARRPSRCRRPGCGDCWRSGRR